MTSAVTTRAPSQPGEQPPPAPALRVTVAEVVAETEDARSLVLEPDPADAHRFAYRPGQFLTLRVPTPDGGWTARCYSLASSPDTGEPLKVTVKRTAGGLGSNWICDEVSPGTRLDVLRPGGTFTPPSLDEDLLLFAAGSGVTPVMSILKSALRAGAARVALVYANRDERSVIFASELRELARDHPDRLHVVHLLESLQGLPSEPVLRVLAGEFAARRAFVCGPEPFMETVGAALSSLRMPPERVHVERYTSLTGDPFAAPEVPAPDEPSGGQDAATVRVTLDGETRTVRWPAGARLLDVLLAVGLDAPFSCREGACSACACRVLEGEVEMAHNEVLEREDLEEGYALGCQSTARTPEVTVTYDE